MSEHGEDPMGPDGAVTVIRGDDAFRSITEVQWAAVESSGATPFSSREWLDEWARNFRGEFSDWLAVECRVTTGPPVTWLLATKTAPGGTRTARLAGFGHSEELGPIGAIDSHREAARLLRGALDSGILSLDCLILDQLRGDIGWSEAFGNPPTKDASNVYLDLRGRTFQSWLLEEPRRSNRYRVRLRKLEAAGGRLIRTNDAKGGSERYGELLHLHELRWDHERLRHNRASSAHPGFIERAAANGWLRMWSVEVDSRTVAVLYGIAFGNRTYLLQTARHPGDRYRALSLGTILIAEAVRDAFSEGHDEVCLMHYFYPYKSRFSDHDRRVQSFWLSATARGALWLRLKTARRSAGARIGRGADLPV